ncbi:MAG: 3-keto-5-aminohexanoate cleavage protein [Candidatus Nealsonbacteria bacterium]|nr:3-keto-5-aminohexanoate cleavage protein [Candidatus Nealsonbacteria bacterium]
MEKKIIITAAVCGSRSMKTDNPAVPYTPKEIIEAAVECHKAGAAIAHIHVRDPETGKPSFRISYFEKVLEGIREKCDMIVNLSTSGLFLNEHDAIPRRLQVIRLKPDICSLDVGSMNFADVAFVNPPQWGQAAAELSQCLGVKPEIEVFDIGHIAQANDLIENELVDKPYYFQLCMGAGWGIPATEENLLFMKNKLLEGVIWSVLGIGKYQRPMITLAMELGGHVRVGFEDNLLIEKGKLAKSNAEFVELAVNLALVRDREPATSAEAREILGLNK